MALRNKNEEFYNPNTKKILTKINDMSHQLFAAGLKARNIYHEVKMYFYKEHSNVTWKEFLTTKFGRWICARVLTTPFMAAAWQWKKVTYCLMWNVFNVLLLIKTTHLCIGFFHHI